MDCSEQYFVIPPVHKTTTLFPYKRKAIIYTPKFKQNEATAPEKSEPGLTYGWRRHLPGLPTAASLAEETAKDVSREPYCSEMKGPPYTSGDRPRHSTLNNS
ncbi:hypothetical protein NPIL_360941 [Nephila pilipes]|uniref:Uncharacterized protein n=1 Tax=Nephila pilipes TaxID=299642 RepID=A0A8X6TSW0_NEPPI|nr:hypothetical protein NPIL_360941 [Nephila pilipes]